MKSFAFLYNNNKLSKSEIKEVILFKIASKKYLVINLTEKVKDLYNENYIDGRNRR